MNPIPITTTPADITKLIEQRLAELPEVKAALDAANANAEAQAATARKIVLDELAEVEAALIDMAPIGDELDADIEALRRQLADLGERRTRHSAQTQQISARARVLTQQLNAEHGGSMINAVLNQLRAQSSNLRDGAARQRQRMRMAPNSWGDLQRVEDPEAQAKAAEMEDKAESIQAAINDIDYLSRQPISPQEIRRRIAEAVAPLGMSFHVDDQPAVHHWQITGWAKSPKAA